MDHLLCARHCSKHFTRIYSVIPMSLKVRHSYPPHHTDEESEGERGYVVGFPGQALSQQGLGTRMETEQN